MMMTTKRRFQALMVLLVLGLSAVGLSPVVPKADARVSNLFPADVDGFPKGRFRADEALFVTLTSDFQGGAVCVVDASVTDPSTVDCKSPRWGEANQYVGLGTLLGVPFEGPLLRPGRWRLLATNTAGVNGTELSEVFEVVSCTPTCDASAAAAQLAPWKARAATQVSTEEQKRRALAVDIATRTYKIASAAYTGFSFGLAGAMLGGGWAAANFDFVVPSTEDLAKALYKQLSATVAQMWVGIADDPPDPNFATVADPEFLTLDASGIAVADDHLDAMMRVAAYGKASRVANERYQGAVAAGDHGAAAMQAEASADFTYDLIAQMRRVQVLQPQVAALGWANEPVVTAPDGEDPATWWADFTASLGSLDGTDLPPADRQFLMDHGMTTQEIDDAIALWADPDWVAGMQAVDPTDTYADALNADTALIPGTIEAYDKFGRWMSLNAADEQAQVVGGLRPLADSQTVDATQGRPVGVTLTGSDPEGEPITFAVADGPDHGTLSGTAPNLTYTSDGGYLGNDQFTFTTNDGNSDSDPATVTLVVAAPVNVAPVANPQTINGFEDEDSTIALTGSDANGDPLTYTVTSGPSNGTLSGTAPALTYSPDTGFTGDDSLTFTVSDGTLTSEPATVIIRVKVNRPPTATGGTKYVVPGVPRIFNLSGSDPDGRPITYEIAEQPEHGTITGDAPNLAYTADDTFDDSDSLSFTVSDGVYTSEEATVTFQPEPAQAVDDSLTVQGAQIIDVAFNDSPPGALVVDVTAAEHGTATCSPYGMCLFVAEDGYVGLDSFDYTLQVGSNTSSATVNVTIQAPPVVAAGKPSAGDDVLQTAVATPGTVDVLANDTGDGTLTATPSDGEHGTVACTEEGVCTYTPTDDDFVGFDVFTYTLSNGTDVDTGLVRVRVGDTPTGMAVAGDAAGDGPSATPGGLVSWMIGLVNDGPVETGLARTAPIAVTTSGPQSFVDGSARLAEGWDLSTDGDGLTATPGPGALIGDQATSILPRPLPPISQGTGGDGHVPILVGSKVFAFFHHQYPTQVTCVDRSTGQLCPGYPKTVPVGTRNNNGPGVVVGSQIWVHNYARNYQTSGMFCWDTATDQTCGMVTNQPGAEDWSGTAPLLVANKLWFATGAGRLQCVDPATSAPCEDGPIDTDITFGLDYGDIVNHGTKVYVSNYTKANCIDVATGEQCAGWPEGGRDLPGNLVRSHDATGAVDGVCGVSYAMNCVRDGDPATVVTTAVSWSYTDTTYSSSVEAEAGTRTFWGSNNTTGLGCFDWSAMALCTGPAFDAYGFSHTDIGGNGLYRVYGAVWDGSCAVALGDPGRLFTMDFEGNSPCTSLDSGAAPLQIDLRLQRFDREVGAATWDQVRVFDTDLTPGTSFTSFLVTIRDSVTREVLSSKEMIDTDGVLDLSSIDATAHPSVIVGATSRSVDGGEAWVDGLAPKVQLLWNADAAPLSFQTLAAACLDEATLPLVVGTTSSGQSARGEILLATPPRCTSLPTTTTTTTTTQPGSTTTSTVPGSSTTGPTVPGTPTSPEPSVPGGPTTPGAVVGGQQAATTEPGSDQGSGALPRTGPAVPIQSTVMAGVVLALLGAAFMLRSRRAARNG